MSYRVCIPTAGTGSRLGVLTKFLNKSLVSIANRPTLAHLIEQFPTDAEFVIALGYKGGLVREFLNIAYPNRKFLYAEVYPFEGPGSGLGLSLLCCREFLQRPFVFISCDTLVEEPVPPPSENWMAYANVADSDPYRTLSVVGGCVAGIYEKGEGIPGSKEAYIGLAGIHDYERFWAAMRSDDSVTIATGEAQGLRELLPRVRAHSFTWYDTGNPSALARAREAYIDADAPNILEKANEAIWFVGDDVVKFSDDLQFIANRVKRVESLRGFVPDVTGVQPHMYRYKKVKGNVLSEAATVPLFRKLLASSKEFWTPHPLNTEKSLEFKETCLRFYRDKTIDRVDLFYRNFDKRDGTETINDEPMPTLEKLLEGVDWAWLADGLPGRFHGDFHCENILWNSETGRFTFLDWRQDFGGDLSTGDIYYDFAKLLHGLIISHELIVKNLYRVHWDGPRIDFDFNRKQVFVECERIFRDWLNAEGYDGKKVWVLTSLVYLNIAPLHHHPYSSLLLALGKSMLKSQLEA